MSTLDPRNPTQAEPLRALDAHELALLLGATEPTRELPAIYGASHHSGRIQPGDAFFALPGADHHGIEHAEAALEAGASLIVSDQPHERGLQVDDPGAAMLTLGRWARRHFTGTVVGITGSAGKTTARGLLAATLDAHAATGNLNTPHAIAGLLLRVWSRDDGRPFVVEMGIDHIGEMDVLTHLVTPDVGLLTAIAPSHLDGFGDVATVAREKSKLLHQTPHPFAALSAWRQLDQDLANRTAPYFLDDEDLTAPPAPPRDAWRGTLIGTPLSPSVTVTPPHGDATDEVPLPGVGRGLAESAVGCLAIAHHLGIDLHDAATRLATASIEPGRLRILERDGFMLIDDAYNANPASMTQALALLQAAPRPHVALLGEMRELGVEADAHHEALGVATRELDRVAFRGDHAAAVQRGNPNVETLDEAGMLRLARTLPREGTILVKASRSLQFERLVDVLLEDPA